MALPTTPVGGLAGWPRDGLREFRAISSPAAQQAPERVQKAAPGTPERQTSGETGAGCQLAPVPLKRAGRTDPGEHPHQHPQVEPAGMHQQPLADFRPPPQKYSCRIVRLEADPPSRARERRVVRRVLVQLVAEEAPQAERVGDRQGDAALGVDAQQVAEQQPPEVDAGPRSGSGRPLLAVAGAAIPWRSSAVFGRDRCCWDQLKASVRPSSAAGRGLRASPVAVGQPATLCVRRNGPPQVRKYSAGRCWRPTCEAKRLSESVLAGATGRADQHGRDRHVLMRSMVPGYDSRDGIHGIGALDNLAEYAVAPTVLSLVLVEKLVRREVDEELRRGAVRVGRAGHRDGVSEIRQ